MKKKRQKQKTVLSCVKNDLMLLLVLFAVLAVLVILYFASTYSQ